MNGWWELGGYKMGLYGMVGWWDGVGRGEGKIKGGWMGRGRDSLYNTHSVRSPGPRGLGRRPCLSVV